jgi:hypothetical protein
VATESFAGTLPQRCGCQACCHGHENRDSYEKLLVHEQTPFTIHGSNITPKN